MKHLFHIVPTEMRNVVDDIEKELDRVIFTNIEDKDVKDANTEIKKIINARFKNGSGACFLDNGDLYSG